MLKFNFDSINENGLVNGRVSWHDASVEDETGYYSRYFETNNGADGVFVVDVARNNRSQLAGTCQFSVYGLTKAAARAKIRRWMNK